ncbi:MAG: cyclic nucleotide-binding domain-containing protein [Verrucomicrobiae bacterium]|nr:cyclic nucleotide-binding domain-containing protein [Verrucomicrobiae bacterium]
MDQIFHYVPIFGGMQDETLEFIAAHSKEERFASGHVILKEGETGHNMYVIAEGTVRIVKNHGSGKEVELAQLNDRDFFGEMCILDTAPRSATVMATTEVRTYSISPHAFNELYQQKPDQYCLLLWNMSRDLSRRLRHIDEVFAGRH